MKTKSKFPIRQTTVKIPPNPQPRCSRWTTLPDLKQNSRLRGGATAGPHSAWTWPNPWNLSLAGTLTATVPQLKIVRAFRRKNLFTPIFSTFSLFFFIRPTRLELTKAGLVPEQFYEWSLCGCHCAIDSGEELKAVVFSLYTGNLEGDAVILVWPIQRYYGFWYWEKA